MLLKKNEKAEKYYTNEGINWKHRSPNKWRGNTQTTYKTIQNNDSKNDQKPWKQNGECNKMQGLINKDQE